MNRAKRFVLVLTLCAGLSATAAGVWLLQDAGLSPPAPASRLASREQQFLAVPDPAAAEEHMRVLTAEPHIAGSPEDRKTAEYVARIFRQAGLETEILEYKVWMNHPLEVSVEARTPKGVIMRGPAREQVVGDRFQDDPRVVPAFNGYSPSGNVEGEVVYVNYGRPEDFDRLKQMGVNLRGKIVLVRYGENFRGVKAYMAQENGAAGVIIYSDPQDDGYVKGDVYPRGPWRPPTAVQRGTIEYGFQHPGDPTTPGFASLPGLPESSRVKPDESPDLPRIPTMPLSYQDAAPILRNLGGPETPREWQGALPFTYHTGPGPVRVHMRLKQEFGCRTIWNVVGKVRGAEWPDEWVMAGNHRDAWVYGAVDPGSGTTVMLEAARGIGTLLKSGWRPRRTIIFASWDAEEQGLIGSTEWVEQFEPEVGKIVAYFNTDTGASGPKFRASAVPSLKPFLREITKAVPSPKGGTLYDEWRSARAADTAGGEQASENPKRQGVTSFGTEAEPQLGNLGSGSDFTTFLDHAGVPATDVRSSGNYGVYHSVFDNYEWFRKFGDPGFKYVQQLARVFGLQVLRMADAEVLPHDYEAYGREVTMYLEAAQKRSREKLKDRTPTFTAALQAAHRLQQAGAAANAAKLALAAADSWEQVRRLNAALRQTERALLLPKGLPRRPYFKHAIYAPADLRGYAASVIPGVNESIQRGDAAATAEQLDALAAALQRAAGMLEGWREQKAAIPSH